MQERREKSNSLDPLKKSLLSPSWVSRDKIYLSWEYSLSSTRKEKREKRSRNCKQGLCRGFPGKGRDLSPGVKDKVRSVKRGNVVQSGGA